MIIALLWLTVSTPFVYSAQQILQDISLGGSPDEDSTNPFGSTTEEKTESNANTVCEYLRHHDHLHELFTLITRDHISHNFNPYIAFHPELQSPPPEFLS